MGRCLLYSASMNAWKFCWLNAFQGYWDRYLRFLWKSIFVLWGKKYSKFCSSREPCPFRVRFYDMGIFLNKGQILKPLWNSEIPDHITEWCVWIDRYQRQSRIFNFLTGQRSRVTRYFFQSGCVTLSASQTYTPSPCFWTSFSQEMTRGQNAYFDLRNFRQFAQISLCTHSLQIGAVLERLDMNKRFFTMRH